MNAEAAKSKTRRKARVLDKYDVAGLIAIVIFAASNLLFFASSSDSINATTVVTLVVVLVLVILIFVNAWQRAKLLKKFHTEIGLAERELMRSKEISEELGSIDANANPDTTDNQ